MVTSYSNGMWQAIIITAKLISITMVTSIDQTQAMQ